MTELTQIDERLSPLQTITFSSIFHTFHSPIFCCVYFVVSFISLWTAPSLVYELSAGKVTHRHTDFTHTAPVSHRVSASLASVTVRGFVVLAVEAPRGGPNSTLQFTGAANLSTFTLSCPFLVFFGLSPFLYCFLFFFHSLHLPPSLPFAFYFLSVSIPLSLPPLS